MREGTRLGLVSQPARCFQDRLSVDDVRERHRVTKGIRGNRARMSRPARWYETTSKQPDRLTNAAESANRSGAVERWV
jgi:hypothetical protein